MELFKYGDRVTVDGEDFLEATVVGHSFLDPDWVIIEWDHPESSILTQRYHSTQLRRIPEKPKVKCPWVVYDKNGLFAFSSETLSRAQERTSTLGPSYVIVDVRTGEWFDYRGRQIPMNDKSV